MRRRFVLEAAALLLSWQLVSAHAFAEPARQASAEQSGRAAEPPRDSPRPLAFEEPAAPWKARTHERPRGMPSPGLALVDQSAWPEEPASPSPVDAAGLARAFQELCGRDLRRAHAATYARFFLEQGKAFGVDPFLLAAVAYRQSRGSPTPRSGHRGGLITIHWKEHAPFLRARRYHYAVLEDGKWVPRELELGDHAFNVRSLRRSESSVYFGAAILRVYQEQCPAIDSRFRSVPHRHPVSHLIWGDRVPDAGSEERLFTDRRRLIGYYLQATPKPVGQVDDLPLYCPLDGAPRKITSGLGDVRGEGHHAHRGLDFDSIRGEPVRAVADGQVIYAGVSSRRVPPDQTAHVPARRMARGGLFLLIQHTPTLVSAYMHLEDYVVSEGDRVKGGQLIAHVGRTGIKQDPAHLHFELRRRHRSIDPSPLLASSVFSRDATYLGQMILAAQPRMWRHVRYLRRLKRQKAKARRASEAGAVETNQASE